MAPAKGASAGGERRPGRARTRRGSGQQETESSNPKRPPHTARDRSADSEQNYAQTKASELRPNKSERTTPKQKRANYAQTKATDIQARSSGQPLRGSCWRLRRSLADPRSGAHGRCCQRGRRRQQPRFTLRRRQRPSQKEALHGMAPEALQPLQRRLVFDALGRHCPAQVASQLDGRAHDSFVALIPDHLFDKGPVDFQLVERQVLQPAEGRKAGAVVVNREGLPRAPAARARFLFRGLGVRHRR